MVYPLFLLPVLHTILLSMSSTAPKTDSSTTSSEPTSFTVSSVYRSYDRILAQCRRNAQLFSVTAFQPGGLAANNSIFKLVGCNIFTQYFHDIAFMEDYFTQLSSSETPSKLSSISNSIWSFTPAVPQKDFSTSISTVKGPPQLLKSMQLWTPPSVFSENLSLIDTAYRRMHSPVTESTLSYFSHLDRSDSHNASRSTSSGLQATTALCLSLLQKGNLADVSEVLLREVSMNPAPSPLNTFLIYSLLAQGSLLYFLQHHFSLFPFSHFFISFFRSY